MADLKEEIEYREDLLDESEIRETEISVGPGDIRKKHYSTLMKTYAFADKIVMAETPFEALLQRFMDIKYLLFKAEQETASYTEKLSEPLLPDEVVNELESDLSILENQIEENEWRSKNLGVKQQKKEEKIITYKTNLESSRIEALEVETSIESSVQSNEFIEGAFEDNKVKAPIEKIEEYARNMEIKEKKLNRRITFKTQKMLHLHPVKQNIQKLQDANSCADF